MTAEKVLIVGEFLPDRLGASYERAFQTLGHEVVRFDIVAERVALAWPARNRVLHRLTLGSLAARRTWSLRFNRRLFDLARESRVPWVFAHNGEWLMPETVQALQRHGKRVVIFHADNPFPPHYSNRPETLEAARQADLYLVWSEKLVEALKREGVRAAFLAFGWDPEVFPYQHDVPQGSWPGVVFIGGWDREREAFLDEVAAHVPLRIYGPGYWGARARRNGRARACWQGHALAMAAAARVVRESAICLNVLRTQHQIDGVPDGVIMRHFEVPGAGGFLVSTRSGVATELFPDRERAVYFRSVNECIVVCRRYINDAESRALIVRQAHEDVASNHTYRQRAREIIDILRHL